MPDFFTTILDFFKSIRGGFLKIFSARADAANNNQPDHNQGNKSQKSDFEINHPEKNQNCSEILLDLDSEIKKLTTKNDELNEFIQDVQSLQEPSSTKRDKIDEKLDELNKFIQDVQSLQEPSSTKHDKIDEKLTDYKIKTDQTPQLIFNDFQSDDFQQNFKTVQQLQRNIQNQIACLEYLQQHYFNTHIKQEKTRRDLNISRQNIDSKIHEISEQLSNNNKPSNKSAITSALIEIQSITDLVKSWRQTYNNHVATYPNEDKPLDLNTDNLDKTLNDWRLMLEERSKYVCQLDYIKNNSQDLKTILNSINLNTDENLKNNKLQIENLLLKQEELLKFKSDKLNWNYNNDMIEQINSAINDAQNLTIQCDNRLT